ncbi:MAG: S16 family serine protease [Candidatus Woesearchaeota archaeon]
MKKLLLLIILLTICIPVTLALQEKQMPLLAISRNEQGTNIGTIANLHVEIVPGQGRIFIDTFPLAQVDTQISARVAKEIACHQLDIACEHYDFIYTIKSDSLTIGGPSAGAALSALTIAALQDLPIKRGVSVTGTIGAGGLVGSVGGLFEKVDAAKRNGITTVLVPFGESLDAQNQSIVEYGQKKGIRVVEVYSIHQVVEELTGVSFAQPHYDIVSPPYYKETMQALALDLCQRTDTTAQRVDTQRAQQLLMLLNTSQEVQTIHDRAQLLRNQSKQALDNGQYYAAASFCFGAGLQYSYLELLSIPLEDVQHLQHTLQQELNAFEQPSIRSITDLQTSMLVGERLVETQKLLDTANNQSGVDMRYTLAFARERFESAKSWSRFFGLIQDDVRIDMNHVRQTCMLRIQEAQQRQQYVLLFLPQATNEDLQEAQKQQVQQNHVLCIFYASKAKAYFDLLATSLSTNQVDGHVQNVASIAHDHIQRQIQRGIFPIAAYSYIEYSDSLREDNIYSALLYAHYGIELSDIQSYVQQSRTNRIMSRIHIDTYAYFLAGVVVGLLTCLALVKLERYILKKRYRKK